MKRVLILGGGFGGVAAARRVRELLADDDEVILVDRATHFMMGFRKTGAIIGRDTLDDGRRALSDLKRFGIDVRHGSITAIDPVARAAEVDGERLEADALLVALGAETAPDAVPGLAEHAINVYAADQAERAHDALASMDKGHVVVGIFGQPYKCPPAPFELALLANEAARDRGAKTTFAVVTPLPGSLPILGQSGCEIIEGRLAGQMIDFHANTKAARVEADAIVTDGDERIPFDLLLAIPPHRVPRVVVDAGLAPTGGWIGPDVHTLATEHEGVYAVGDCTVMPMANGKPMPKAGEFAQGAGVVAAERIAALLTGTGSDATFWGDGACFLESGYGEAMLVRGRFLAEGGPQVELTTPSAEHLEGKRVFERDRLDAWFGPR